MTGRTKYQSVNRQSEIEKSREESNWSKVIELATQMKDKSPELGEF